MTAQNVAETVRLDGVALVTGVARSIGLAAAHAFGQARAKLNLSARRKHYEDAGAVPGAGYDARFYGAHLATRALAEPKMPFPRSPTGPVQRSISSYLTANDTQH